MLKGKKFDGKKLTEMQLTSMFAQRVYIDDVMWSLKIKTRVHGEHPEKNGEENVTFLVNILSNFKSGRYPRFDIYTIPCLFAF